VPLTAGTRLGVYEIRGQLGAGGMGEVYLADDTRLGREVALKLLPPDVAADAGSLARFEREARTVAALNHPGIVTLHGVEHSGGIRFLVMERVSGRTLADVIGGRGLPVQRILELAVPMADALAAAHDKGIVHRDLKPNNVMVTDEGRVKILDFGLAKTHAVPSADGGGSTTTVERTASGQILGTIPYMAPEQCRGERVDSRTDLFAFGAILYEMAGGVRAFPGESSADVMSAVLKDDPAPLEALKPALPARFSRLVKRCLEKDPRRRVQSAIDLRAELQDLAEELRSQAVPQTGAGPSTRQGAADASPRRPVNRWLRAAVAIAVVGLAVVGTFEFRRWRESSRAGGGTQPIESLAVLPFENLTKDPSQDYFVEGMHDAIITELVRLDRVKVTSRAAVMRFKGKALAIKQVARELGVDAVIEGSVLRSGGSVRIGAKLILGATDQNVWARSYDRDLQDVLSLLRDVSSEIAGEVRARVGQDAAASAPPDTIAAPRVRPEAYEAFLRGRYLLNQSLTSKQVLAAREQLLASTSLDPGFAPAWSALASTYVVEALFGYAPRAGAVASAHETSKKALALSPDDGSALAVEGMAQLYFEWDFEGARPKLERAVAIRPHDWMLRHGWADYLMVTGRFDESLEQTRLGRSDDPTSFIAAQVVLFHSMAARRFDDAIAAGRHALLLNPAVRPVHGAIGTALWQQQKYDEAIAELRLATGGDEASWRVFDDTYRRRGPEAALRAYSSRLAAGLVKGGGSPVSVAEAFAQAGDLDRAMEWLERAYAGREPAMLHVPANVAFEALRGDPRFEALLRRVGVRMPALPTRLP
jgi:eukaryotic-like serine/threonine-protein kinase